MVEKKFTDRLRQLDDGVSTEMKVLHPLEEYQLDRKLEACQVIAERMVENIRVKPA
jgi:hypothetical protein